LTPTLTPTKTFTPTVTSTPVIVTKNYDIFKEGGDPETQRSKQLDFTTNVKTVDILRMEFSMDHSACSDISLHIILDGSEVTTIENLGPLSEQYSTGIIDLGPLKGKHKLTLSPEGIPSNEDGDGSCNHGTLFAWAGKLTVYTNEYK
jgi:hypothetical protein